MRTWLTKMRGAEFKVMRLQECPNDAALADTPERVVAYLRLMLPGSLRYNPDVENLGVVFLSARRKPIGFEIISNGSLDTLLVHAREVFKPAILMNASAIVLFHSHPSGDSTPSQQDIQVTRNLIAGGTLLQIEVLDHVILGRSTEENPNGYHSLRELGYFY